MSTGTKNIAHLRIFIRGVFTNLNIFEQFLGLVSMQINFKIKDAMKQYKVFELTFFCFYFLYKNKLNVKNRVLNKNAIFKKYC